MRVPIRAAVTVLVIASTSLIAACTPPSGGGGSSSTTTTTRPASDPRTCPTPTASQVRVAVVVDSHEMSNGSATPSVVCVVVASGASGVAALAARAIRLGTPVPRYDPSGLLCAIDGIPAAPACGNPSGSGFLYWSYWVGGSSWTYANVGPASRRMVDGTVEGWRFISGGAATAPGTSASFASLTN